MIPYFSANGHCAALAAAIAKGAGDSMLMDISKAPPLEALKSARAIVFGAPTYMGGAPAAYCAFLERAAADWPEAGWTDKIAAGFTTAVHPSGDKLATLQRFMIFAMQMGMVWVGQTSLGAPVRPEQPGLNQDGAWLGLMGTDDGAHNRSIDLETAHHFGARIRKATDRWG